MFFKKKTVKSDIVYGSYEDLQRERKRTIFRMIAIALAAGAVIAALCIAWFVSNNRVGAGTGAISAKALPFSLATKKANKGTEDEVLESLEIGKGTEYKSGNDTYYISNGGSISLQVSADSNMNNVEGTKRGILPGSSGKITFYVIPWESGYKEFSFQLNLKAYSSSSQGIEEITGDNNKDVSEFLKGHILFFKSYDENTGYTDWINNGNFEITNENEEEFTKNTPIPITVYWVWPEYFQSFMNTGELFNSDVREKFVKDMNTSPNKYFSGFNKEEIKITNDWTFESLNANQFTRLTEWYNDADFEIGTKVNYFYFDFECN